MEALENGARRTPSSRDAQSNATSLPCDDELSLGTPMERRDCEMNDKDAARTLQELCNRHRDAGVQQPCVPGARLKRSRPLSGDNQVQASVRELLRAELKTEDTWSDTLVRSRSGATPGSDDLQVPVPRSTPDGGRKRACCSTEAAEPCARFPTVRGLARPALWLD